jgi:hypothetical protein
VQEPLPLLYSSNRRLGEFELPSGRYIGGGGEGEREGGEGGEGGEGKKGRRRRRRK